MDRSVSYPFTTTGAVGPTAAVAGGLPATISGISFAATANATIIITDGVAGKVLGAFAVPSGQSIPPGALPGIESANTPYITVTGTGSGALWICPEP
jgi:hypothetical protein